MVSTRAASANTAGTGRQSLGSGDVLLLSTPSESAVFLIGRSGVRESVAVGVNARSCSFLLGLSDLL